MLPGLSPIFAGGFKSFSTDYFSAGGYTVAVPPGATKVTIEGIGASGASGLWDPSFSPASYGAWYAKRIKYPVSGLASIYLYVGPNQTYNNGLSTYAQVGGVTVMLATGTVRGGGPHTTSVGDVINAGSSGGGAGGPLGPASGATGGGAPAGNKNANYGGGSQQGSEYNQGHPGWGRLTWY